MHGQKEYGGTHSHQTDFLLFYLHKVCTGVTLLCKSQTTLPSIAQYDGRNLALMATRLSTKLLTKDKQNWEWTFLCYFSENQETLVKFSPFWQNALESMATVKWRCWFFKGAVGYWVLWKSFHLSWTSLPKKWMACHYLHYFILFFNVFMFCKRRKIVRKKKKRYSTGIIIKCTKKYKHNMMSKKWNKVKYL